MVINLQSTLQPAVESTLAFIAKLQDVLKSDSGQAVAEYDLLVATAVGTGLALGQSATAVLGMISALMQTGLSATIAIVHAGAVLTAAASGSTALAAVLVPLGISLTSFYAVFQGLGPVYNSQNMCDGNSCCNLAESQGNLIGVTAVLNSGTSSTNCGPVLGMEAVVMADGTSGWE